MRSKIFALALSWLCLAGPLAAQPIDMEPICAAYAGRTLFFKDSRAVALDCAQLTAFSAKTNLKEPMFKAVMPHILKLAVFNLDDLGQVPSSGAASCSRFILPGGNYGLRCQVNFQGVPVMLEAGADADGFITEVVMLFTDFRPLFRPLADRFGVPFESLTDELFNLALDVMIAKDATFAIPDLSIGRFGSGFRVKVINIPRTSAPRIRQG